MFTWSKKKGFRKCLHGRKSEVSLPERIRKFNIPKILLQSTPIVYEVCKSSEVTVLEE